MLQLMFHAGLTLAGSLKAGFFCHCNFIKTFLNRRHVRTGKKAKEG